MNFDEADLAFACDLLAFVDIDKSIDNTYMYYIEHLYHTAFNKNRGEGESLMKDYRVNSLKKVRITV